MEEVQGERTSKQDRSGERERDMLRCVTSRGGH